MLQCSHIARMVLWSLLSEKGKTLFVIINNGIVHLNHDPQQHNPKVLNFKHKIILNNDGYEKVHQTE